MEETKTGGRHVGVVGEKITTHVTVRYMARVESVWGTRWLHVLETDEGDALVWRSSSGAWSVGTRHKIRVTVKAHRTYKEGLQTVVVRPTIF